MKLLRLTFLAIFNFSCTDCSKMRTILRILDVVSPLLKMTKKWIKILAENTTVSLRIIKSLQIICAALTALILFSLLIFLSCLNYRESCYNYDYYYKYIMVINDLLDFQKL